MRKPSLSFLALLLAPALATAQVGPLVGFTGKSTAPASSNLTRQIICNPPTTICPNALPAPTSDWAGGAAYNPMTRAIWHSEGTRITEIFVDTCQQGCSMPASLVLGTTSLVGGLKIDNARNQLIHAESIFGTGALVIYQFSPVAPCPTRVSICRFSLPSDSHRVGALAFDAKRDVFYVATSIFGAAAPANALLVIKRADPTCQPFCTIQVTNCFTGLIQSIRAMTYDECNDILYISDGRQTSVQSVIWGPALCPILRPTACCPLAHPAGEFWAGFDLEPIAARQLGGSCTERPCANCPAMSLSTLGDPAIGNQQFGFRIQDGPTGAIGLVLVGIGPCTAGLPFSCGLFYPAPVPFALPAFGLAGGGLCDGSGQVGLPIPNDYTLCNGLLCVQGLVICLLPPAFGLGLTNALVVPIGP